MVGISLTPACQRDITCKSFYRVHTAMERIEVCLVSLFLEEDRAIVHSCVTWPIVILVF